MLYFLLAGVFIVLVALVLTFSPSLKKRDEHGSKNMDDSNYPPNGGSMGGCFR